MTFARFAPQETDGAGNPAYVLFIREVNGVRPGTFGAPEHLHDQPYQGYETEKYPQARVVHGPGDEGVRVVADSPEVAGAFREAARRLNIHIPG